MENKVEEIIETPILENLPQEELKKELTVETTIKDYVTIKNNFYAGFFLRLVAFFVDLLMVVCLTKLVDTLTFGIFSNHKLIALSLPITYVVTYYLYFILMTYYFNQTIGKMLFRIKVEKNNGEKLVFSDVLYRELVGRFLCDVSYALIYLVVGFTKNKKGLHDYIADTVVVKEDFTALRLKLNQLLQKTNS